MKLVHGFVDFFTTMWFMVCGVVTLVTMYPVRLFLRVLDFSGAVNRSRWYIRKEFARAVLTISREMYTCPQVIEILKDLRCLPDLVGFDSVITLLRHRHRTRAFVRLQKLSTDWGTGKVGFKTSKPELPIVTDESF